MLSLPHNVGDLEKVFGPLRRSTLRHDLKAFVAAAIA